MLLWLAGVTLFGVGFSAIILIAMLTGPGPMPPNAWLGVVIPPGMVVLGLWTDRYCCYLARDEARFLTDFLIATLDARGVEAAGEVL